MPKPPRKPREVKRALDTQSERVASRTMANYRRPPR
jgi:hypothetical protein